MDSEQVLGETLDRIIQLTTSAATNAKKFKFHWVSSFSRVPFARGPVLYRALVVVVVAVVVYVWRRGVSQSSPSSL